jgi:hypothetical protein
MIVTNETISLIPGFGDTVEFQREDVRRIEVEHYRGPFVFRTLFWVVTSKRHRRACVPARARRLLEALQSAGWPIRELS